MKVYWKYYIFPFFYGIIFSWYGSFHSKSRKLQLWETVAEIIGGNLNSINTYAVCGIFEMYVPFFLFCVVFSTYIYRHFCNSSVYVFARCANRVKWYMIEILKLYFFSVLNMVAILLGYIVTGVIARKLVVSLDQIWLVTWYISLYSIWCFAMTLLANILSILKGSAFGISIVFSVQAIFTIALLSVDCEKLAGGNWKRFVWNPVSYLIGNWYSIHWHGQKIMGIMSRSLTIRNGYLLWGGISAIVVLIGIYVIQTIDIIHSNKEL